MAETDADQIELLILDVDGVLTDGGIQIDDHGVELKRFSCLDGLGLRIWQALGYQVAIITGRHGMAVRHRTRELDITHLIQGRMDKKAALAELLRDLKLSPSQVAMIGDDLPDLPVMRLVGYPIAVGSAVKEVQQEAAFVTVRGGGAGAVREAVEHLLRAKDRWEEAVSIFE
ncbi:MAG: HAD-IIIA family hydrolase [Phycisphaerales bacterium]|nr:MAG: HAD-IIIA family hydrolase [Phycisphaerales bacterium]